ncbi:CHAD domain-containing protein [Chitinilyticum litopenaei]|uniref:CHAD domain-containing protein n=1 Tax=Chitinilyticum litopenaei TaxID=1121276 RepID=UPI00041DF1CF|nr:CHAD domain-containing protein [Chitinilyticum litopenaei]
MSTASALLLYQLHLLARIGRLRRDWLLTRDAETLHDLRVAMRNWRALLPLLGNAECRTRWRTAAQQSNAMRDLDVQLALLQKHRAGQASLTRHRQAMAEASERLRVALSTAALDTLLLDSTRWLACSRPVSAGRLAQHRRTLHTRLLRALGSLAPDSPPALWHALRLAIKRLRYLNEAASSATQSAAPPYQAALKAAQGTLGELHDVDALLLQAGLPAPLRAALSASRAPLLIRAWQDVVTLQKLLPGA